jgi:putative tricarboxylic transport membrane protein
VLGVLGFGMRYFDYPVAPVIIGLILGPLAEQQLRRALAISQGDPTALVETPLAIGIYVICVLVVVGPLLWRMVSSKPLPNLASSED